MGSKWDNEPRGAISGRHDYTPSASLEIYAQQRRTELAAMSPELRRATVAQARASAKPGSYLARHFEAIYGEKL